MLTRVFLAAANPTAGLPNAIVTGIILGSVITLGAIGLSLTYGIARVPNFAHGELLTIGAYLAMFVNKPSNVPLLNELLGTGGSVSTASTVVLFVLTALAVLGTVYQVGGDGALSGGWWPYEVTDQVGYGVHGLAAALVGAVIVALTPSIWGGMLFAAIALAAIAPVFDKVVFKRFRERGDDLATLLIAALGLSFVLRYSTQAIFGGGVKEFALPKTVTLAGSTLPMSDTFFFEFFAGSADLVVRVVNTAGETRETAAVVGYSWPVVVALVVVPLGVAYAGYRWRRGAGDEYASGQTVGPRLTGALAWGLTTLLLVVGLASGSAVPEQAGYGTRVRLSFIRALTFVIALGMMGGLHFLLKTTRLGTAMRASSDNLDLAKVTGINTDRVVRTTWVIAGAYSAIAGIMLGVLFVTVTPNTGFNLLLPIFAGVILGGVESVYGAMVGSYVVGLAMSVGIFYLPISGIHRVSVAFLVLIVILLIKPEGIMGGQ